MFDHRDHNLSEFVHITLDEIVPKRNKFKFNAIGLLLTFGEKDYNIAEK